MEAISPISTPSAVTPPPSTQPSSPPPSQRNATSPSMTTLPQSPPVNVTSPPPAKLPTSPPSSTLSPPPQKSSPPPLSFSPPPPFVPPLNSPPPSSSSPPPSSSTPPAIPPRTSAPPPPLTNPPKISPPPSQPSNSPPPPALIPPTISPPPPALMPPISSPSPPALVPPISSPSPPALVPPTSSPPPPGVIPPKNSPPPPPSAEPPKTLPPSPTSPPPPATIPGSGPSNTPPPASSVPTGSPPTFPQPLPPSSSGASPSGPSLPSPSSNPTNSTSSTNTSGNSRSTGGGGISNEGTVAIGLIFGLLFLGSVGMSAWCIRKRKKKKNSGFNGGHVLPTSDGSPPHPDSLLLKVGTSATNTRIGSGNSRSWFTYEELLAATDGFASHNLLGEGGFGFVYKGHLRDGREVAVKQLRVGGGQGEREFRAEVEIISRVHHRHLVTLVGYCISENRRMLVYDYIPNNNLYFHLHENGQHVMDWAIRLKVAAGAARGIAYLHEDCHPRIVHRDIKSSNILIDDKFEARVSDFGLAKLFEDSNTHISTRVIGTFGYMAPEYASSGKLTEKSDVFSYGVVLLELITGRKPVDESQPPGEESLVEWARPLLSHAFESGESEGLVDPRLQNNYVDSEMARVIEIAAACVRHSAIKRPQMGQVVRVFESMSTSDLSNGMRVGESQIVNPQHSEEMRLFHRMAFDIQDFSTAFFDQSSSHAEP